ncbi:MAG: sulfite exporter TauE/SafE family protein [Ectothiorhodospiraceae bacterium]|nr:sulfite exporter TauE/SafE family protein [Ectothiorhodospiraceae bacterium]
MPAITELEPLVYVAVLAVVGFAGLVHGTLGLGFPLVATPVVAAMSDVRTAILLTLLPTVTVNVASIVGGRGYGESLRRFWPLVGASLVGAVSGSWVLAVASPEPFRLLLAVLIVSFLWVSHRGRVPGAALTRHALVSMIAFGLVSGFAGGTTNVMVAVLIVYFLAIEMPRATMVPIMNTCFMTGKLSQIVVLWLAGLVTGGLLAQTLPLAGVALIAVLGGQRLRERVPIATYRRILHWLLAGLAALLVYQFLAGLGARGSPIATA